MQLKKHRAYDEMEMGQINHKLGQWNTQEPWEPNKMAAQIAR